MPTYPNQPTSAYPFDTDLVAKQMQFLNDALGAQANGIMLVIAAMPIAQPNKAFVVGNAPPETLSSFFRLLGEAEQGATRLVQPPTMQ